MGEFSADWLAEREIADGASRSSRLARAMGRHLGGLPLVKVSKVLNVLDLATGTGSNVRYLADYLPGQQHWLLVDRDPVLLDQVPQRMSSWAASRGCHVSRDADGMLLRDRRLICRLTMRRLDLDAMDAAGLFVGRGLVTASALLDLVSNRALRVLAERCRQDGSAALFALTYDGRIQCSPEEPEDETVRELVNRHQRTDKGFGTAVGPDATDRAEEYFTGVGYRVQREPSDWLLPPEARNLQRQLIVGWAEAAATMAPLQAKSIASWRARRLAHVEGGRSRLVVGHADLAAWLPPPGELGIRNSKLGIQEDFQHAFLIPNSQS